MNDEVKIAVKEATLEALESSLSAQLKAVQALRRKSSQEGHGVEDTPGKGRSQMDLALDILQDSSEPLHVSDIIARIKERFDVTVDRESLVSAMTKKVARGQMFVRVAPNTFKAR